MPTETAPATVAALHAQIAANLRWITQMQAEIQREGHAGWSNTLDDIAGTLRDLAAFLARRG